MVLYNSCHYFLALELAEYYRDDVVFFELFRLVLLDIWDLAEQKLLFIL